MNITEESAALPFDTKVTATLGATNYLTSIIAGDNTILGDEPTTHGGQNKGLNPYDLLAASLAMCTSATLRMYSQRKGIDLGEISVEVTMKNDTTAKTAHFIKTLHFEYPPMDEAIIKRLKAIAEACPVNKLLTNAIEIETKLNL